jgi:hypothetical protein
VDTTPAIDPPALVGTWRLERFELEDPASGSRRAIFGERPTGYLVLTPAGRLISVVTARPQPAARSEAERAAAFMAMLAYSGRYRIEGDRFVTEVDTAWDRSWVGTSQIRQFRLHGDILRIETAPQLALEPDEVPARAVVTWRREE